MPGMEVPEPGGTMKKMQFEFTDPSEAAAQGAGIPPGAGVLPAGAQQAAPAPAAPQAPMQGQPQEQPGAFFGQMAGGADQFGQGPDSSMFTDDQLASLLQSDPTMGDPIAMQADQMHQQLMGPDVPPELQMQMMEAARRMGGF